MVFMIYPDYNDVKSRKYTQAWIHKEYPEFYLYLLDRYSFCNSWGEKVYCFYNHIDLHPQCPVCGKLLTFLDPQSGYRKYCSPACAHKDPIYIQNIKNACIEKYGVDNVAKSKIVQDKMKSTCIERYGVSNALQNESIRDKVKRTCLERYGVENVGSLRLLDVISNDKINDKYTYICPHHDCDRCSEKTYICTRYTHNNRKELGSELCTNILPERPGNNNDTYIEHMVRGWLDDKNIQYETNVRNVIYPNEIDIYIPGRNIAIECNGVYWHSDKRKLRKYHINKYHECEKKGIELISLWEDQLLNQPEICKNIILSKLGIYQKRYYARCCDIKEISSDICNDFLDRYHLQGHVNGCVRIGLYYGGELLSVMVFGKSRKCMNTRNNDWEMYRFCNKEGIQVVGGCSKLFLFFLEIYTPSRIISFSNNDISSGHIYRKLGFSFDHETLGYWYIDRKMKRYHRYSFTKGNLIKRGFDISKSESEIMSEIGYYRIYDSGQKKWIYTNEIPS